MRIIALIPRLFAAVGIFAIGAAVSLRPLHATSETTEARQRLSLNEGWRFQKDDPANTAPNALSYDKIKFWILPTANAFITEKFSQRAPAVRPEGATPGEDVAYTFPAFDDSNWRKLDLPHDWGIEGPFKQEYHSGTGKLPFWGIAWYRKTLDLPAADAGKRIFLDIDGAMSYSTVWCNGKLVGGWPYGYMSYRLDLTPYVKPGAKNTLAIRIDNPAGSSRWYPGGGIYRNVWLVKTNPVHVAQWGTRVTTPQVSKKKATIVIETEVTNDNAAAATAVTVETKFYRLGTPANVVAESAIRVEPTRSTSEWAPKAIPAGKTGIVRETFTINDPILWDTKTPNRYIAVTTVKANGKVVDVYQTPFGIRSAQFTADNGFLLNGERVQLNGVCNHHDLGALGAAINTSALERQILLLKEMGCNAIRTSHNPPAPELLILADKHGILILDEYADMWERRKVANAYSRVFKDWSEADLRSLVKRDRNHPSVIAWSTGNEVGEQGGGHGSIVSQRLTDIAHESDPSRPTTSGCNYPGAASNGFSKTFDVYGYNYKPHNYNWFHQKHPNQPVYSSESASALSSRGEYYFPISKPNTPEQIAAFGTLTQSSDRPSGAAGEMEKGKTHGRANYHVSDYALSAANWAYPPDVEFLGLDKAPFAAGEFVWTGFDYLGEPTPYGHDVSELINFHSPEEKARAAEELKRIGKLRVPSRSSYFGIIDLAGFPKDRFYIYQARWNPTHRMARIVPHWNWPERVGKVTPVHIFSAADEAELFLNGKSLGRKKRGQFEYRFRWDDVKYVPGTLKVVTWKNGEPWAESVTKTTGPAAKLLASPNRDTIVADGKDLAFVTVRIADAEGLTVPRTHNALKFTVSGPGEIVATDNGNPTDHTTFSSHDRKAFNGLALVIVRAKRGVLGKIVVRAEGDGLTAGETVIQAK